jgi:hypothetical protein
MTKSRFHSFAEVEKAFRFQRPDLVNLLLEIRNIVMKVSPLTAERIHSRGITFYDPDKGGTIKGGICFVDIQDNYVRLRFGLGVFLEDPKSLLTGKERIYMRHMDISSFDNAPWKDIEALIHASANLNDLKKSK